MKKEVHTEGSQQKVSKQETSSKQSQEIYPVLATVMTQSQRFFQGDEFHKSIAICENFTLRMFTGNILSVSYVDNS